MYILHQALFVHSAKPCYQLSDLTNNDLTFKPKKQYQRPLAEMFKLAKTIFPKTIQEIFRFQNNRG